MTKNDRLPEVCYAIHPETGEIVGILNGEAGYRPIDDGDRDASDRKAWVDAKNRSMGVAPSQREAMFAASMFGWHVALANPANFPNAIEEGAK